jgi:hypothetical protein
LEDWENKKIQDRKRKREEIWKKIRKKRNRKEIKTIRRRRQKMMGNRVERE